ncbi:hypothetical protein JOM56_008317 [Amanita muscaria]
MRDTEQSVFKEFLKGDLLLAVPDTTGKDLTSCAAQSAFQQAVLRNVGDKNAQLQKQLENVVREGKFYLLFTVKIAELERDLEIERRKNRELQDAARDRDKEYQKLKVLLPKF